MRVAAVVAGVALAVAAPAVAAWSAGAAGSGRAAAQSMPAGNAPTGAASGFTVTVTWPASSFAGGGNVPGYRIRRRNALGTISNAANGCSGVVTTASCVETSVPAGTWRYDVTPVAGSWTGATSAVGNAVVVPG